MVRWHVGSCLLRAEVLVKLKAALVTASAAFS